ncbi:MAG: efflux RND transporter permease subunit, partial [Alphaproteobacteria bacterium]|nr:efflux RND transporter permease subunit [Alphaproteobacteria bacterium]
MFGSEFIKRPIFTTVLSLMILTIGVVSFNKLELRGTPNIAPPVIMVNASYKGADASYMEGQIVRRLEEVLKTTKNLDIMTSSSSTGAANIYLSFKLDADIDVGLSDVRSKISSISNMFPRDMNIPSAQKLDIDGWPSIWISINSDRHTDLELTQITNNQIKDELEKLPTVGQSILYGGKFYTMKIEPHESKLLQHKISLIQLDQSIVNQNKSYPAGVIKSDTRRYSLKLDASLKSPSEFEDIIVKKYPDGTLIKLKDIARVSLEPQEEDVILRYNGKRALAIGLIKQSTANIIELSKEVKKELKKIKNNIPEGISIEIAVDNAVALKESIDDVFFSIFEAIILVGLVTYIFLGSIKITIIPLVTIPISLIGSFAAMHWCGFSINSFSLLAMLLAIGLVVDDAIVMLENIFRHKYELGKGTMQAAQDGAYEISFAVVAMTLTLASVFLPIGFLEGFLGKIFIEFAWTLAFCVLFSGFVSLTLTPMMCSKMMGDRILSKPKILQNFDIYFELTQNLYINLLKKALGNKKTFFAFSSLSIVVLIAGFYFT